MQVESTSQPMLTMDEVEQIQRKKVATIIGHVFQLTYAAFFDKLVQEEKVNRRHGCTLQHPSQRQHSCLMLDTEDAWFYYHDVAREQIDLAVVMQTVEGVCSTLGLKLCQTWKSYLTELPKLPWTSLNLTSLELENYDEDMKERVLYALYYGPCGLLKRTISVEWKSTKMTTLKKLWTLTLQKCNVLRTLSEKKKN